MAWPAADRVIFAKVRKFFSPPKLLRTCSFHCHLLAPTTLRQPPGRRMANMQNDQNLSTTLYLLGFNLLDGDLSSGEIAEIKGDMTIKLMHPPGEELKFVIELPGEKQMTFSVDRYQIVTSAESWQ